MGGIEPLGPEALYRVCKPENIDFDTTDDAEALDGIVGQMRASSAVRFGIGMRDGGFNIFALGPQDTDKQHLVRHFIEKRAREEPPPQDFCYVHNFDEGHKPIALCLPAGKGCELARDMDAFLRELKATLSATFESEEYQSRRQSVQEEVSEVQQEDFERLQERAREQDLALLRTPAGFVFAPVKDGDVLSPGEIEKLSEEERKSLESRIEQLQEELQSILRQVPRRQREARDRVRELDQQVAHHTVHDLLEELRNRYGDFPQVRDYLDAVESDIVARARQLISDDEGPQKLLQAIAGGRSDGGVSGVEEDAELRRYRVNVIVDHTESEHAPFVYEDHPTYHNLLGRVEYLPRMGALVTDFNMIKAGALHRSNGGYLMVDALRLLLQPFAWEALKRALHSGEVRIESPREALGLVSTVSLEPQPIALDVKVVLLGSRLLYYLLAEHDPDFTELFKVEADFDDRMDRNAENEKLYARLVADLVRREELRPFDRSAVARVIERSARLAGDAERLSVRTRNVLDLLLESDYWAGESGGETVTAEHVQKAIDQWIYRSSRIRDRMREEIIRDTIYIDTEGSRVGQVNGLSVIQLGDFAFGRPNRITARVRLGKGEVIDIEREVELSGPIHSKGVLILSGFLGARYASERPLSLSASLVFEQSYGGVEGDSASSAELYALLSAIADLPLAQSIAVTGSVNQHGQIQPIGGVNEKIEGFFDVCSERGLRGDQGVLIPRANVKHLMLRSDVVAAVAEGNFHIWPVDSVDQGMELLTGFRMGERGEHGEYPLDTVNHRVEERLSELAARRREFARIEEGDAT
jgi:lon-related putative ATP-dependent protease